MITQLFDRIRGAGDYSVTIPPLDGVLKPNNLIDTADVVAEAPAPDNITPYKDKILFSSGNTILEVGGGQFASFANEISCLASDGGEALAIGFDTGGVRISGGAHDGQTFDKTNDREIICPTSMAFKNPDTLVICLGSRSHAPSRWKWDLMERNACGSVWQVDLKTGTFKRLADKLAFAAGVAVEADGRLLVAESWRHRVLRLDGTSAPVVALHDLPVYVSRITPRPGGYAMAAFAPRRQMVEFILREPEFKRRMMSEVPDKHWMAPALSSGKDFLEPLQGGQVRHLGVLKPWAPTKSYGLAILMDTKLNFTASLHSRTGGERHGITSCLIDGERLIYTSRGGDVVLSSCISERTNNG